MVTNEQAIRAFKELRPHLETIDLRTTAIVEMIATINTASEADFDRIIQKKRGEIKGKWDGISHKIENALKEKPDIP